MRAFIVRPFGTKEGIDFDHVQSELIQPALKATEIDGNTTAVIARAGNIRTDMFEQLLLADIVIADISIDNANVYYELGIRHSLRPRTTILIRARKTRPEGQADGATAGQDAGPSREVPFDLKTDRYLEYNHQDPGGSRANLIEALRQSLAANNDESPPDSPVYLLLPALEAPDVDKFRPVPIGFRAAVTSAQRNKDLPMLAVLADEAADFEWALAGLRLVADAQFMLKAWPDARATCEAIRDRRPGDSNANLLLGTIYDRLHEPVASRAALERILGSGKLTSEERAEALALKGRDIKNLWIAEWEGLDSEHRQAAALRSPQLESSRRAYDEAFLTNQNHWYSGINALALLVVRLTLAELQPAVWSERFEDEEEAASELTRLQKACRDLTSAVRRSLEAEAFRTRGEKYNVWADLTKADLRLLTSNKPAFVAAAYDEARARLAAEKGGDFPADSAAQQIRLYLKLGVFADKAQAALEALGVPEEPPPTPRSRVIVFSGHRIDAPGRQEPRFPSDRVDEAAEMIRAAVLEEKELAGASAVEGIAGGASGGDILFHEICAELGITTTLLLAIPQDDYVAASVADAGPDWVERFRKLAHRLDVKILPQDGKELPSWAAQRGDYSVWQRNNRWTLHTALSRADTDVSLIVLWDGKGGDGPGGTEDMVRLAQSRGVKVVELPASRLTAETRAGG